MYFDCFLADAQRVGNPLIYLTSDHQSENLSFAARRLCHTLNDDFAPGLNGALCFVPFLSGFNGAH